MEKTESEVLDQERSGDCVFAMDIGTRSIIGIVGRVNDERLEVLAIHKEEHASRAMIDGQIEDIGQVAKVAGLVRQRLEEQLSRPLHKVYVAAAGRALKTQTAVFDMDFEVAGEVTEEVLRTLETGALNKAEEAFEQAEESAPDKQFYLVGYSVKQYYLDNYPISNLLGHRGKHLTAQVIATFLPSEVVESLYSSMQKAGMEVAGMTLEPIASMNAAIPAGLRLLNLVLVDIGAGTSDIAAARDGSICGYTMATVAGDEVTECLMKEYLVDFATAERLKMGISHTETLEYTDVLGLAHTVEPEDVAKAADGAVQTLCRGIAEKVEEVNEGIPSAVFLTGGGSKLGKVREYVAQYLGMDLNRVALGGNNFSVHAFSEACNLQDPEYSTPLGIAISAGLNLINDSFYIRLNGQRAKLFRSGKLTVRDILMMNGYSYRHLMSRSGQNLIVELDGERKVIYGGYAEPAVLQLNGEPAGISDFVKAGDEITFVPAVSGEDAGARLRDLVTFRSEGSVIFNGVSFPLGVSAAVNGQKADGERLLQSGDKIETCRFETVGDFLQASGREGPVYISGQEAPPWRKLSHGDVIREEPGDGAEAEPAVQLTFEVNGKRLSFSGKPDGTPFYLMDMLMYTDVDYSRPEGYVVLKVNGQDAEFQTELRDGDRITVDWSERRPGTELQKV